MSRIELPKGIFTKKTGDYTFAILFFLIFSMFIVFAIKPSLTTAASLKKEETDLTKIDSLYETEIIDIANIQQLMEENRNDLPLLSEAMTTYPKVNKMVGDIKTIADANSFLINKASVADVNLLNTNSQKLQKITVILDGACSFDNLMKFTQALFAQRRLKTISSMTIGPSLESTDSATLNVTLNINGYFL